VLPEIEA
jgi:hypothetical protein